MVAFIAITIISSMLAVMHLGILSLVLWFAQMLIGLAYFIAWIICTVKAFQGSAQRIPFAADLADRWVPKWACFLARRPGRPRRPYEPSKGSALSNSGSTRRRRPARGPAARDAGPRGRRSRR